MNEACVDYARRCSHHYRGRGRGLHCSSYRQIRLSDEYVDGQLNQLGGQLA